MILEHARRKEILRSFVFEDVDSFDVMVKQIIKISKKLFGVNEDAVKDFRGAAFEVFCEFFLKKLGNDSHIGFTSIESTSQDKFYVGTDFYGTTRSQTRGQIQAKFRSNPTDQLDSSDLGGFFMRVVAEKTTPRDILIITNVKHTRTRHACSKPIELTFSSQGTDLRVLGREDLTTLTDQCVGFWADLRETLALSCLQIDRPVLDSLWAHQERVHRAVVQCIESIDDDRLQAIIPTGGGKTRNKWETIRYVFNRKNASVVIVFAPTIELLRQHAAKFNLYGDDGWEYLHVRTGKDVERRYGDDEDTTPTTDTTDITNKIVETRLAERPLLIMCTYASALTVTDAIQQLQTKVGEFQLDLAIADEAHRLVTLGQLREVLNIEKLPTKKWIFFTATRKFGAHHGMNVTRLFGKTKVRVLARELIENGIIVRPRVTFIRIGHVIRSLQNQMHDLEQDDRVEVAAMIRALQLHRARRAGKAVRVIAFNTGAEKAHDFAESSTIQSLLEGWFVDAVSSKVKRMKIRDRQTRFASFQQSEQSLLMQFAIVKEGIDIPGITGVVLLRDMNTIDAIQSIGRAVRLTDIDRKHLKEGLVTVGSDVGWDKYYAEIYVLANDDDFRNQVKQYVKHLRSAGYETEDVEWIGAEDKKAVGPEPNDGLEITPYGGDLSDDLLEFDPIEIGEMVQAATIEDETEQQIAEEKLRYDEAMVEFEQLSDEQQRNEVWS